MRVINFFQFKMEGYDELLLTAVKVSEGKFIYWAVMYWLKDQIITTNYSNKQVSDYLRIGAWTPLFEGVN